MSSGDGPVDVSSDPTYDRHLQRLRAGLFKVDAAPTRVHRYEIEAKAGAGGMGTVYRARDPELGRVVAVKLIACRDDETRRRALIEARALASISHPNVAQVFDVGLHGLNAAFIAMEFIDGPNLRVWIRSHHPRPAEVVAVLRAAGWGLVAAHEAGIVHRDFKPSNVLVARGGLARVIDFGIAVSRGPETLQGEAQESSDASGTPGYMAPEQAKGIEVDPRADQYAFCVTLYEGIVGRRPDAEDMKRRPEVMPPWIWRVVERGLQTSPEDRFDSMRTLLDALRPRRARWVALGALAGIALIALGVRAATTEASECLATGPGDGWTAQTQDTVRGAFSATGLPYAAATFDRLVPRLDAHVDAWARARGTACAGDLGGKARDRAVLCLQRRAQRFDALLEQLGNPDARVVQSSIAAVERLESPDVCLDEAYVAAHAAFRRDDPDAERFWDDYDRFEAVRRAGQVADADARARALVQDARTLGAQPRIAAGIGRGETLLAGGETEGAIDMLTDAYFLAVAEGQDRAAARAIANLIGAESSRNEVDRAKTWARHGENVLDRIGSQPHVAAQLAQSMGKLASELGQFEQALALHEQSVQWLQEGGAERSVAVAMGLNNMAAVEFQLGHEERGLALSRESLRMREAMLGPQHPDLLMSIGNLAAQLVHVGELDEARELGERALELANAQGTPAREMKASALVTLGNLAFAEEDLATSGRYYEDALDLPLSDLNRALIRLNLANVREEQGRVAVARSHVQDVVDTLSGTVDDDHPVLESARAGLERLSPVSQ